ncbi:hypothetical protein BJX66DRAFT_254883 [Aspergillus keveii]|uniref:Uncharacterized protein n=1 Tax=Aspergillus keveii TaxID=714993 RepID=A0ABR4FYR4_9EURO
MFFFRPLTTRAERKARGAARSPTKPLARCALLSLGVYNGQTSSPNRLRGLDSPRPPHSQISKRFSPAWLEIGLAFGFAFQVVRWRGSSPFRNRRRQPILVLQTIFTSNETSVADSSGDYFCPLKDRVQRWSKLDQAHGRDCFVLTLEEMSPAIWLSISQRSCSDSAASRVQPSSDFRPRLSAFLLNSLPRPKRPDR